MKTLTTALAAGLFAASATFALAQSGIDNGDVFQARPLAPVSQLFEGRNAADTGSLKGLTQSDAGDLRDSIYATVRNPGVLLEGRNAETTLSPRIDWRNGMDR